MTVRILLCLFSLTLVSPALAHVSNQAFTLLLPTELYIGAGVIIVALTIVLVALPRLGDKLTGFPSYTVLPVPPKGLETITSLFSFALFAALIYIGLNGSRDPLLNPLPLTIWTIWWVAIILMQGILGNLWHWINPWTGLLTIIGADDGQRAIGADEAERATDTGRGKRTLFSLPEKWGAVPAIVLFLLFSFFMLAHPTPEDPAILARIVAIYWVTTFLGCLLFGSKNWFGQVDFVTLIARQFTLMSFFGVREKRIHLGFPGWKLARESKGSFSIAIFVLFVLGTSSFDGFNETFLWLSVMGINPLEFPGRSAIIGQTIIGIVLCNITLVIFFAFAVWLGLRLVGVRDGFGDTFCKMAPAVLPIAVGYHFAHYLAYFLVNIQYALVAFSDPLTNGMDILGLGQFYVTTGFFNNAESAETIFQSQAFAVVAGHVVSILMAHRVMAHIVSGGKAVLISQIPMAIFMVAYTFFGLWLLAAPKGA